MAIPYELEQHFSIRGVDPNQLVMGPSYYYYSDANPRLRQLPTAFSLIEYESTAVAGQIEIVIGTPLGSEDHEPLFGCDAFKFLFDGMTQSNLNSLELEVLTSLRKWLGGRLDFLSVTASVMSQDRGDVLIVIPFRVKLTGEKHTYVGNLTNLRKMLAAS